jgi:hypothetical protein
VFVVGDLALSLVQRRSRPEVGRDHLARDLLAEDVLLPVAGVAGVGAHAIRLAALVANRVKGSRAKVTYASQVGVHPLTFALEVWEVGRGWQLGAPPLRVMLPPEYHDLVLTSMTLPSSRPTPYLSALVDGGTWTSVSLQFVPNIVGVYVLWGIGTYFYLRRTPEKLKAFGSVHNEETPIVRAEEGGILDTPIDPTMR